ncbi:MAG: hypothetical protein H0T51_08485, partial [Pirellulales bacterium]|nr:hypothetical protein [Pirellulales bacterium]
MNSTPHSVTLAAGLLASTAVLFGAGVARVAGAEVTWVTSPGLLDTEVSTAGTQILGYYFSAGTDMEPPVVMVNRVPFASHTLSTPPAGLSYNGSYENPESFFNLYRVTPTAGNTGLNQILDGQTFGFNAAPLTVNGLTPGQQYQLQYMVSDDRFLNNRNYDVSDSNDPEGSRDIERAYHSTAGGGVPPAAPPGSREAKIFTGAFIADASGSQDIYNVLYNDVNHTSFNAGSQVNAIQVRAVPQEDQLVTMCFRDRTIQVPFYLISQYQAYAATFGSCPTPSTSWVADGPGDWFIAANWSDGVPTASTNAHVDNGGTAQIMNPSAVARNVSLGSIFQGNGTLEVVGVQAAFNDIIVGLVGAGALSIR